MAGVRGHAAVSHQPSGGHPRRLAARRCAGRGAVVDARRHSECAGARAPADAHVGGGLRRRGALLQGAHGVAGRAAGVQGRAPGMVNTTEDNPCIFALEYPIILVI